ncbi:MAG: transglycosylase domain-containing protein [Novosphingobium sp.]
MVAAVIAGEDAKFCSHGGFDTEAIEKAIERNARSSGCAADRFISQQTARTCSLAGHRMDPLCPQGVEVWFTVLIENLWGKRRIMEVYLNVAETGIGTYGVEAGAQRCFKHSAAHLDRIEAARIAAAPCAQTARGRSPAAASPTPPATPLPGAAGWCATGARRLCLRLSKERGAGALSLNGLSLAIKPSTSVALTVRGAPICTKGTLP